MPIWWEHFALGPLLWPAVARAEQTSELQRSAWHIGVLAAERGFDNSKSAMAVFQTVASAVIGVFIAFGSIDPWPLRLGVAILVALTAYWLMPLIWAAVVAVVTPTKQRDAAREALAHEKAAHAATLQKVERLGNEVALAADRWVLRGHFITLVRQAESRICNLRDMRERAEAAARENRPGPGSLRYEAQDWNYWIGDVKSLVKWAGSPSLLGITETELQDPHSASGLEDAYSEILYAINNAIGFELDLKRLPPEEAS